MVWQGRVEKDGEKRRRYGEVWGSRGGFRRMERGGVAGKG